MTRLPYLYSMRARIIKRVDPIASQTERACLEPLIRKLRAIGLLPDEGASGPAKTAFLMPSRHDDDSEAVLRIIDRLLGLRLDATLAAYLRQIRRAETFPNDFEARLFDLLSRQEAHELPKPRRRFQPKLVIAEETEHCISSDSLRRLWERLSLHGVSPTSPRLQ